MQNALSIIENPHQPWEFDSNLSDGSNTLPIKIDAWLSPQKTCYFFCDLHADGEAFLRSLKLSELITATSQIEHVELTPKAQQAQIIIGGDCFDKGPSNLKLFKLINQLRAAKIDLILLAGNHDIRVLAGLIALDHQDDYLQNHFIVRMGRKTVAFFKEVYQQYALVNEAPLLSNAQAIEQLSPPNDWFEKFADLSAQELSPKQLKKEFKQMRKKQIDLFEAALEVGLEPKHLHQAIRKAQQLFLDPQGDYAWFLKELKLVHQSGSYLFCHAGLDDKIANHFSLGNPQPCDDLNQFFQQTLAAGKIYQIYYSEYGNVVRTKYRDDKFELTQSGAEKLRQRGIFAIVNGHRSHTDGQKLYVRQGILNFECDTELNVNCRKKRGLQPQAESVTIFAIDGTVKAFSNDLNLPKAFHPQQITV